MPSQVAISCRMFVAGRVRQRSCLPTQGLVKAPHPSRVQRTQEISVLDVSSKPGVAVRRGHQTGAIAVIGVEPAHVSIEAKSKSPEAPVPKAAAKMAKAASKMPAVTAAHRKSVAYKAASTKAMSAPPKNCRHHARTLPEYLTSSLPCRRKMLLQARSSSCAWDLSSFRSRCGLQG